ncbi:MAG: prepilin-type N-terminal cleavage/methylation domain-containing protein [Actinomycetota bacterium]|nr:prepilin-type N-terminal cleavage/methylation domain-containing protein [Actinomycetota bacterium]
MAFRDSEGGFTLVELLSSIAIFAVVSTGFYSVLFSVQQGSKTSRATTTISSEARLGFNRMVRDTREGEQIETANPTSFTVRVDYESDGLGPQILNYSKSGDRILLDGETLMKGVDCVRAGDGTCSQDVFHYTSNRLEYDWDTDGVTTWQELDESSSSAHGVVGVGNNDGQLNTELPFITDVTFALMVGSGGGNTQFIAQAQLRNRR